MADPDPVLDPAELRRRALARWDNEGGATTPAKPPALPGTHTDDPIVTAAELAQLHVRIIALENLMIAVLAEGTDRQLQVAREMAAYIAPRPGFTQHPLTTRAAHDMSDLVERAVHFRTVPPAALTGE